MVNFLIVADSDDKRRVSYAEKIGPLLPPVKGLITSSCSARDCYVLWAAGGWTPVSHVSDEEGLAIIFGDAISGSTSERLTAEDLRELWSGSSPADALDGFHAAVVYSPGRGLLVGADLLGLFPIYYYGGEEVALVGSSPELFRYHPLFEMKFNPAGFVGILLTKGLVEGQTLLSGVKRLSPGHLLNLHRGKPAEEKLQFRLPISTKYFDLKLMEQVEILDQALDEAISRHVPKDERCILMLSGGIDSRLLGGYLKEKGLDFVAYTEGLPTDIESKCAKPVADTLGFKHIHLPVEYKDYPYFADLSVTWQQLYDGFTGITLWGFHQHFRKIASKVASGFMADGILGNLIGWARPKPNKPVSFRTFWRNLNRLAFRPETLNDLLKENCFEGLIQETLGTIKKNYESYSRLEFQRVWGFSLHNKLRFHDGSGVWLLSFGAWPILPFVDHRVIETAGGMPLTALTDRRIEKMLLKKKFPSLARLPVARYAYDTTPLVPTSRHQGLQQIFGDGGIWKFRNLRNLRDLLLSVLWGERRYWPRSTYFNSPGWKTVRTMVMPHLHLTSTFLEEKIVRELLPPVNSTYLRVKWTMTRRRIRETSALKILMGFTLWLQKHNELCSH